MSVLKTSLAIPSRIRGIYRYLLQAKGQREKKEKLEKLLSPEKLFEYLKDKKIGDRPMFSASLREGIKCGLFTEDETDIMINPDLPDSAKSPKLGDQLLPNTLVNLFFASDNEDEYDFGLVCAWYLAQDIYNAPKNWEEVERAVNQKEVQSLGLKMTSNSLFGQMEDWMCYLGLAWGHSLEGKRVLVPDPTAYIKRNLDQLFDQKGAKILIRYFITRLADQCPLFETGHFRDKVEEFTQKRQFNTLSTSTAFALFRLQDEGYIQLIQESDADLMLLPKANNTIDNSSRISHIIYL
jgi:hypothetical protein